MEKKIIPITTLPIKGLSRSFEDVKEDEVVFVSIGYMMSKPTLLVYLEFEKLREMAKRKDLIVIYTEEDDGMYISIKHNNQSHVPPLPQDEAKTT